MTVVLTSIRTEKRQICIRRGEGAVPFRQRLWISWKIRNNPWMCWTVAGRLDWIMFIHAMMATEMATASVISVSEIDCWRRDRALV
jgi:hypothetical protein